MKKAFIIDHMVINDIKEDFITSYLDDMVTAITTAIDNFVVVNRIISIAMFIIINWDIYLFPYP